ncbi:glycosyl hydrolase [Agromyces rhizosphaerae]|uniref:Exo-alpha-(1->6)-L-arabinopyranosidase n=1 Tax=Agromyces rhizosphaerae TaxID=88374 RepID=A0A9W6CXI7_9MICO|nr:glycoside hydrolase family 3 C-terminal domain-containing protein [Agromyces rhizosphaerae]GLI27129.1 glycosyl hydrolase [Agromyces rhizosphaerae]
MTDTLIPAPAHVDAPQADPADIVRRLTRRQKVSLLSGADFWTTEPVAEHDVPSIMLTDGPHGLRKQTGSTDHVGFGESVPATCFPPAVTLGSTWDPSLIEEVGAALGRETRAADVGVILGPGLNLKRHPAGGRSFEYFSEDPLLSGKSAAALVRGIQSEGVGACLKHFAVNNQESNRMRLDTVVDERTLRELYLTGFEIAVAESDPWTVMSAYNLVNGEHAGESRRLLTQILRDEWGFQGMVVSDWLAVADRPVGVDAGLDLEMPSSEGVWDRAIVEALEDGSLDEAALDAACGRVIALALRVAAERSIRSDAAPLDFDAHHGLARRAAAAGTVLLTNDGMLPLRAEGSIALIGAFAETPRYQGAGSSMVNPTRLDTALEAMRHRLGEEAEILFAPGYDPVSGDSSPEMLEQARAVAREADVVVVMVGLPATYESEGFDRTDLRLPADHDELVRAVTDANPRTAVVLSNGAAVEIDWADRPAALLEAYLGGQASGSALIDVLFGDAEPGGRLAESIPVTASELPASENFANHATQVEYRETLYVGYRFHDTFEVAPRHCFGHGLSYTAFTYSDVTISGSGTDLTVELTVTNTGDRTGSDVVQVYVHDVESSVHRPEQELRGFTKVHLAAGASERVVIRLGRRAFATYDVAAQDWLVEAGAFEIRVGASSRDIRASETVVIASPDVVTPVTKPAGPAATDAEFAALLGRAIPAPRPLLPLHLDSAIDDLAQFPIGRILRKRLLDMAAGTLDMDPDPATKAMIDAVMGQMPLRGLVASSGGKLSFRVARAVIRVLNLFAPRRR